MSNKLSAVLILCMSTAGLSGCDLLRVTGPCYGVGCPAGAAGHSGQYKQGEGPKAQNAPAPANSASAPTPTAATQPKTDQSDAPAHPAVAQTAVQHPAAPGATAEAKPSPLHSVGEFFAHLIPHHNSVAKSGASD
ncbi:MAG TPA: hypothetical protein VIH88_02885 [Candidatus Acidoferrales bacterium]